MVNTDRLCKGCMNDNGGERNCPICGHDSASDNAAQYLSIGTWLNNNRYLIGKVIEENGDTTVYIGWDNDNNDVVHIAEYLPAGLARRSADRMTVSPADNEGIAFNRGLDEFVQLFTALSKIPTTAYILPVVDIFESNGTVYAVTSTVSSITLKDFLIRNGGVLKWEQIKLLFIPLLTTISQLHEAEIVHRGISPETILVGRDGHLYLSGFSIKSARVANTEFAYKLAPGFSAPEQYDVSAESGVESDVYAIGAVIFRAAIGSIVPDAKERLINDKLSIPANAAESISKGALIAIAGALKVNVAERTPSAEKFKKMIEAAQGMATLEEVAPAPVQKKSGSGVKYAIISSVITALIFLILILLFGNLFGDVFKKKESEPNNSLQNSSVATEEIFQNEHIIETDDGVVLPNWTGYTYSEILSDINKNNYEFEIVIAGKEYSENVDEGRVIRLVEHEMIGKKIEPNSRISVVISLGKSMRKLPDNLMGMTIEEAEFALLKAGFSLSNVTFRPRVADGKNGTVIGVSHNGDVSVDEHITIDYCDGNNNDETPDDNTSSGDGSGDNTSSEIDPIE